MKMRSFISLFRGYARLTPWEKISPSESRLLKQPGLIRKKCGVDLARLLRNGGGAQHRVNRRRSTRCCAPPLNYILPIICLFLLTSCEVGPNYKRPAQHLPATFASTKTNPTTQTVLPSDWWKLFHEPELTRLENRARANNPGLQAAMQRVEQARAAAGIAKSAFYPVITFDPSFQRQRTPANVGSNSSSNRGGNSGGSGGAPTRRSSSHARTQNTIRVPFDLSYEVDIWGRVRRNFESAKASALAQADDYEVVLQTLQADVAQDYFALRLYNSEVQIYDKTVASYQRQLELTQKQRRAGLVGQTDVAQAQAELESTKTQEIEARRNRDITEHAIAILLGEAPGQLSIASQPLHGTPPAIPPGLPVDLLLRRADVAEAEQNLIAANAQIGVAIASALPTITLTGSAGFESSDIAHALDWEQRAWSLGTNIAAPIFEGGLLKYGIEQARAHYAELVANYRQTVLQAIGDVEDSLVDLHRRADEARAQAAAVAASRQYLQYSQVQYRQGLISYLQIIDADRTLLTNQLAAVQILNQRLTSTVLLIKALGGGWHMNPATTRPYSRE